MLRGVIRLAKPWIGEEELAGVADVLRSGMLVQGRRVAALEAQLAERCGRAHAVACGSGTSALELALGALGVRGDVLCPDLSWPSPAHAIVRAGARPVLVDVDPGSWNVTADALAAARTEASGAAVVIDQLGTPAHHPSVAAALGDLPVVVDAACSLGATVDGAPAPSFGAVACLSFHPRKLITTGEGGACLTDDAALAEELRVLRNHGQRGPGAFAAPAGNHRMTEMAAALGLAQLARLDEILARRRALAERYRERLAGFALQTPAPGVVSNWQTFGVVLPEGVDGDARDALVTRLRADGVEAGPLSYALHRIGSLEGRFGGGPDFPVADAVEGRGLALPMHPLLEEVAQDRVIEVFLRAVDALDIAP
jgi:perosamine synthetase